MRKVKNTLESVKKSSPDAASSIEYTVFVPEDASDKIVSDLMKYLDRKAESMGTSEPPISITFTIIKAGGNAGD
jgi:hypothetical protein